MHAAGAERGGLPEPLERRGVLGDVVRRLADPLRDLGDDVPFLIDDLDTDARRTGIAPRRAVTADDQKTRIRRQCSHLLTPSTRLTWSSSIAESCSWHPWHTPSTSAATPMPFFCLRRSS